MISDKQGSLLEKAEGFDWDEANINKNWRKHKVNFKEAEQTFFNKPLLINFDQKHSAKEKRFQALGKTSQQKSGFRHWSSQLF